MITLTCLNYQRKTERLVFLIYVIVMSTKVFGLGADLFSLLYRFALILLSVLWLPIQIFRLTYIQGIYKYLIRAGNEPMRRSAAANRLAIAPNMELRKRVNGFDSQDRQSVIGFFSIRNCSVAVTESGFVPGWWQ